MSQLSLDQFQVLKRRMLDRFAGGNPSVWEVVRTREQHYYQAPEADPPMIEGYESHTWQSSILRDTWTKYRARLTENPWSPQLSAPRSSPTLDATAADCELYLQTMFADLRSSTGDDLQGLLADGMGIYNYGILHCYLADDALNAASARLDYDERDELPEDAAEAKRYTDEDYPEDAGRQRKGKYRETDASLMQRRDEARALADPPWQASVWHPAQCAWVEDRSKVGGFRYFLTGEQIAVSDWLEGRLKRGDITELATAADVGADGQADNWRPTARQEDRVVTLWRLWSREHIYEWVDGLDDAPESETYRCVPNRVHRVPFWLAPGMVTLNRDVVFRYEPLLTSLYRLKPIRDRYMANLSVLAEASAIPRYWCVPISDNNLPPLTDDMGHVRVFGANAIEAIVPPDGYKYERIGGDGTTGQYERLQAVYDAEMQRALPDTGVGDIRDTTQPWTARIMQQVGNIVPSMAIDHLIWCLLPMVKMIVEVMADEVDGPGDVAFFPKDGKSLIKLAPADWEGLRADVTIDKISAVERTTAMQAGLQYVESGAWTWIDWIEQAEGQPDPQRTFVKRETFKYWQASVLPLQMKEAAAKALGSKYSMQPVSQPGDTPFVGGDGRGVMPAEVLARGTAPPEGTQMADMATLQAPETAPVQGLGG